MTGHHFDPVRLLLGVILLGAALVHVMDALGEWQVPMPLLLVLVPGALAMAAVTGLMTYAARRRLSRRGVLTARRPPL
jgi:hypothetical protein